MSSSLPGTDISTAEVTNISSHGFWLLNSAGNELFLSFEDFPWFKNQSVGTITKIEEPTPGHYYWPDIDVDLSDKIIEDPASYPLKSAK